jgi:DNA-binding response OmpR family regulator
VGKTILIIDDDVDFQFMVGSMLRTCGYEVRTLLEGKLNVAVDIASKCDMVLLDIELPGLNGVHLGKELRASPKTSNIPIIVVSGHNNVDEMFIQSQATAFIRKPFSLTTLVNKVQALLVPPVKRLTAQ